MLYSANQSVIGLDIQPLQLNLLQIKKNKKICVVEQAVSVHLDQAIFQDNKIVNWENLYIVLSDLLKSLEIKTATVALSLPINLVRTGCIEIPLGLSADAILAEIIANEPHDLFGREDELCIDYQTLPSVHSHLAEVYFASARKKYVSEYVSFMAKTGLMLKILDIDLYALQRAVLYAYQQAKLSQQTFTLIHLATTTAAIINIKNQKIVDHHVWSFENSSDLSLQINEYLQKDLTAISQDYDDYLAICALKDKESVLKPILEGYKNKIDYLNPFQFIKISSQISNSLLENNASDFLVALGLAMQEVPKW